MTKYYIDTEFLEGTQKKFPFGNTKPTIDLISIGLIDEKNRIYYAISKDFNLKEAWNRWQQRTGEGDRNNHDPRVYWIRDNVLYSIYVELFNKYIEDVRNMERLNVSHNVKNVSTFSFENISWLIDRYGKSNKQIANDICAFILGDDCGGSGMSAIEMATYYNVSDERLKPIFYGYFADYDWVVFAWLFGNMMALPKDFPMYCRDLKQTLDETAEKMELKDFNDLRFIPYESELAFKQEDIDTLDKKLALLKSDNRYPKQQNEHNALSDAIWNKELHQFIELIS